MIVEEKKLFKCSTVAKGMPECSQTFEYSIFWQYLLNVTEYEKISTPDHFSSDENSDFYWH